MMHSPVMRVVGSVIWLITALGCIHLGLTGFGYDPLSIVGLHTMSRAIMTVFGIAGVVSLIMFFMGGCCNDEPTHSNNGLHR